MLAKVQKQLLGDIGKFVSSRIKQLGQETPQSSDPNGDPGHKMV
jgi:hypothetical protein